MPFDDSKFDAPATRGDVAGVAIKLAIALNALVNIIKVLPSSDGLAGELEVVRKTAADLNTMFDTLTGYRKE